MKVCVRHHSRFGLRRNRKRGFEAPGVDRGSGMGLDLVAELVVSLLILWTASPSMVRTCSGQIPWRVRLRKGEKIANEWGEEVARANTVT